MYFQYFKALMITTYGGSPIKFLKFLYQPIFFIVIRKKKILII